MSVTSAAGLDMRELGQQDPLLRQTIEMKERRQKVGSRYATGYCYVLQVSVTSISTDITDVVCLELESAIESSAAPRGQ